VNLSDYNRAFVEAFHREADAWLSQRSGRMQPGERWTPIPRCIRCQERLKIGEVKLCAACKAIVGEKT